MQLCVQQSVYKCIQVFVGVRAGAVLQHTVHTPPADSFESSTICGTHHHHTHCIRTLIFLSFKKSLSLSFSRSSLPVLALFLSFPLFPPPLPALFVRTLSSFNPARVPPRSFVRSTLIPSLLLSPLQPVSAQHHNHVPWTVVQDRFRPSFPCWRHSHHSRRVMNEQHCKNQICS